MFIYPPITLTFLNGFLLVIPLLALRFGIPALGRRETLAALDHFPLVVGKEKVALKVYLVTNTFLIFSPLLAHIVAGTAWWYVGWTCYALGVIVLGLALWSFSTASGALIQSGLYRFSRNPIYVGYFLIFIGVALLIGSWFHLALTLVYQAAVHFLILSEERWCLGTFGKQYLEYQRKVRRYF
jgi:protein-S-isoprenylcysteine O-methyltransferase Ste14